MTARNGTDAALGTAVVVGALLAAALVAAVVLTRGPAERDERYVPGPGPTLDPAVPIRGARWWNVVQFFEKGACRPLGPPAALTCMP